MSRGYDWDAYMEPVWKGRTVRYESVSFFPEPVSGSVEPAPLLYTPARILGVYSADLQTEYRENQDYIAEGECIRRTEGSRIPVWDYDSYYLKAPSEIPIECVSVPGRYVLYDGSGKYPAKQIAVTYESDKKDNMIGEIAGNRYGTLPGLHEKLKEGRRVNIVYYGDSVMEGSDGSGMRGLAPFMPIYSGMVTEGLKRQYPHAEIRQWNTAAGGMNTVWGVENAVERVAAFQPDLAVIGFGCNDASGKLSPGEYQRNNYRMVELIREVRPETEFMFMPSILPNPECKGWTGWHLLAQCILEGIVRKVHGTALVPMRDIYLSLLSRKRYPDIQGNGVNHPNDFLYRIYAQALLEALIC